MGKRLMAQAPATHVPPQNIEAEESVLGAMLVAEPILARVIDEVGLTGEDFYLDKHAAIFECIHDLYVAARPADELSVGDALNADQREQIEKGGGDPRLYLSELAAKSRAPGNAKHYAEIVKREAELCRLNQGIQRAAEAFASRNGASPGDLFGRVTELIQGVKPTASLNEPSSWRPLDLSTVIDGDGEPPPTILARSDGPCLIYDGRLHQISAEPEAGKGWWTLKAVDTLIGAGCTVVYIDFESTPLEIVSRLEALGVSPERIVEQLVYLRPHEPLTDATWPDFETALAREPALVVIDGQTEALTIHGFDLADNADIARWLEKLARPATRAGAAVVLIDHVVKNKEQRGRYAIGAQHKLAGIDVAYSLEVVEPFGRGKDGKVRVRVEKDRPGHVRPFEGEDKQVAMMRLRSDAETGAVTVDLDPPEVGGGDDFRPTHLMERISRAVDQTPGMTTREIRGLGGKAGALDAGLRILLSEGYIRVEKDGQAHRHQPVRPYSAEDDEGGSE
jgi:DnaB-like helicase N terminal domain/AAA domain